MRSAENRADLISSICGHRRAGPGARRSICRRSREAKALLHWHARHRFCSNCGAPTNVSDGRLAARLSDLQRPAFSAHRSGRHHAGGRRRALPAGRGKRGLRQGMWSCLAGFVEPGETIEDAVRRETLEEAGIRSGRVRYFASQPWPFPSSLMIGCHAEALVDRDRDRRERTRGCALVHPRRGRRDAQPHPSGRPHHAAAGRHRASHHPGLGRERGRRTGLSPPRFTASCI